MGMSRFITPFFLLLQGEQTDQFKNKKHRGAWLVLLVKQATLDTGGLFVSLQFGPHIGQRGYLKKKFAGKKKKNQKTQLAMKGSKQ